MSFINGIRDFSQSQVNQTVEDPKQVKGNKAVQTAIAAIGEHQPTIARPATALAVQPISGTVKAASSHNEQISSGLEYYPRMLENLIEDHIKDKAEVIDFNPHAFANPSNPASSVSSITAAVTSIATNNSAAATTTAEVNPSEETIQEIKQANILHDLELQKSLLLKNHPNQIPFIKGLVSQQVSLERQVLFLRRRIHLEQNPEYSQAACAWQRKGISLEEQVLRLKLLKTYAFGTDKWEKHFGPIVGKIPQLPENIFEILYEHDAEKTDQTVMNSHVLVLVPSAVNVNNNIKAISLTSLGKLVKTPKEGNSTSYEGDSYAGEYAQKPVVESHWVLMRKEILLNSRSKTYDQQKELVKGYSKKAGVLYEMPNAVDVAACCLMTFVSSGIRLFEYNPNDPQSLTYTRCQEKVEEKWPLVVGGFSASGLIVSLAHTHYDRDYDGVVAARKF